VSERRICRVLGQHRSTHRKVPRGADDEQRLTDDIIALAKQYGRYGYRRVTALLRDAGWTVNRKRVERIWRKEGLKVPQRQPKRGRLWLNDGSCIRLRPEYPGHVWAYDFVEGRTHDGRKFRILTIIDEASRECLALIVARQLKHEACWRHSLTCSSLEDRQPISGQIMAPSLSPPPCRSGSARSA
jgi:putative transposase